MYHGPMAKIGAKIISTKGMLVSHSYTQITQWASRALE